MLVRPQQVPGLQASRCCTTTSSEVLSARAEGIGLPQLCESTRCLQVLSSRRQCCVTCLLVYPYSCLPVVTQGPHASIVQFHQSLNNTSKPVAALQLCTCRAFVVPFAQHCCCASHACSSSHLQLLAGQADLTIRCTSLLAATAVQNQQELTESQRVCPFVRALESSSWPPSGSLAAKRPAAIALRACAACRCSRVMSWQ